MNRMARAARAEDLLSARIADLAYRGGASFVAFLPERLARGLGRTVADLCWRLSPRRRTRLMQNLKRLLPELDARALGRESRRAFGGFGESVVDTLRLTRTRGATERRVASTASCAWKRLEEGGVPGPPGAGRAGAAWRAAVCPRASPEGIAAPTPLRCQRHRFGVRGRSRSTPATHEPSPSFPVRAGEGLGPRDRRASRGARRSPRAAAAVRAARSACARASADRLGPRPGPGRRSGSQDARAALEFLQSSSPHRGQWFALELDP
jgi:hypothetical protein